MSEQLDMDKELMEYTIGSVKVAMTRRMQLHQAGHSETRAQFPHLDDVVQTNLEILYKLGWAHGASQTSDFMIEQFEKS